MFHVKQMREPTGSSESHLTVRGSRFLGLLNRVEREDDAKNLISAARNDHPGASHVAYAFSAGSEKSLLQGLSDDGEPHGTAGRPILDQISGAELSFCLVMVVRYFGGTKLGTGGLVRAYGEAARLAIEKAPTRLLIQRSRFRLQVTYEHVDPAFRLIEEVGGVVSDREFGSSVVVQGSLPTAEVERFAERIGDLTSGKSYPEILDSSLA